MLLCIYILLTGGWLLPYAFELARLRGRGGSFAGAGASWLKSSIRAKSSDSLSFDGNAAGEKDNDFKNMTGYHAAVHILHLCIYMGVFPFCSHSMLDTVNETGPN